MRYGGESKLGALRQAAILALSGFMLMSSLAALGSGHAHTPAAAALDERSFQDSSTHLAPADQGPAPSAQPLSADCRSSRAWSTSGCSSPSRSTSSDSTSARREAASSGRPASSSIVAYSSFAPVANR